MDQKFSEITQNLEPLLNQLLNMSPVQAGSLPKSMPKRGIYLFSEKGEHLYVGRSNNIRRRIRLHCRPSATHLSAAFAFLITRKDTGKLKPSYKKEGSRKELMSNPEFNTAFTTELKRINKMDLRFIEVNDPIQQALFEIYVHIALQTPFNNFDNH